MSLPPTYEEATNDNIVAIMAPYLKKYLDGTSLAATCRLSKEWRDEMSPRLWRDPLRIISRTATPFARSVQFLESIIPQFGNENKPYTLDMVLTLTFGPLLALRSQSHLQAEWRYHENLLTTQLAFRSTQYFPNLRFIIVSGLKVEADSSPFWGRNDKGPRPIQILLLDLFELRELRTSDVASSGTFVSLMFLDLSGTTAGPEFTRQYSGGLFPNLRILKLRNMNLTNSMLPGAVLQTEFHLWSLDLSFNNLTDRAVDLIIDGCFLELPPQAPQLHHLAPLNSGVDLVEAVPRYTELPAEQNNFRADDNLPLRPDHEMEFNMYMQRHALLTQHIQPILDINDDILCSTGLTQLYIRNNKLTASGIYRLLRRGRRLQVLDAGSVICSSIELGGAYPNTRYFMQPDSVHPIFQRYGNRLEVLRIHHSLVTYCPTIMSSSEQANGYSFEYLYKSEAVFGAAHKRNWGAFVPSDNHRIRDLTLTSIPWRSYGMIIDQLKEFLVDAAKQEAQLLKDKSKSRRAPKQLSGLRQLTLEMMREDTRGSGSGKSASGDKDADIFAQALETDYTFFSGSDVEKLSIAPKKKPVFGTEWGLPGRLGFDVTRNKERAEMVDETKLPVYIVLDELKKFRAEMEPKWSGDIILRLSD